MTDDRRLRRAVAAALFLNASLVFVLQPHISKRLLPVLGGSAEVWIVCTLFFQLALLAGYLAAFFARRLPLRVALGLHVALIGVAWLVWPISVGDGPAATASPSLWTLQLLVGQVGLLFTALTATSPLLQTAFARAAPDQDPYPLFAASNAGSLAGLFAYPLLAEPFLTLDAQARAWGVAALLLLALLVLTATQLIGRGGATTAADVPAGPAPRLHQRLRWLILSLVPSMLLLAVTAQITTDIAPVPLLWTIPLGLYLASFIRVFAAGWRPSRWTWTALAVSALPMLLTFPYQPVQGWWTAIHLAILWCGCVLCHGQLVQERPAAPRLAEFYLWLALGGALGGVLAGISAPLVFVMRTEYPLAVLAVLWLAPRVPPGSTQVRVSAPVVAGLALILVTAAILVARTGVAPRGLSQWFVLVPTLSALLWWHRPRFYAACATLVLLSVIVARGLDSDSIVERGRSFYGTHSVRDDRESHLRLLFHGTTIHGLQSLRVERRAEPLSYYGRQSPVADVFRERVPPGARVGLLGLGAGVILRYARPDSSWTVYEIDTTIAAVAKDRGLFSHWADAAVTPTLVIGDGRLRLREAPDASFDLIVFDAFSSDTIPVHLVTREALALYARKLRPGGSTLFHISNRYLDLGPALSATARSLGLDAVVRYDHTQDRAAGLSPSIWVLVGSPGALTPPTAEWSPLAADPGDPGWSDDFSNVVAALRPVRAATEWLRAWWRY